jgi:hypothetical protein
LFVLTVYHGCCELVETHGVWFELAEVDNHLFRGDLGLTQLVLDVFLDLVELLDFLILAFACFFTCELLDILDADPLHFSFENLRAAKVSCHRTLILSVMEVRLLMNLVV